jgi:hypothetical protein
MSLLQGKHIDLNLIKDPVEFFTDGDDAEIDGAIQRTRDIYVEVSLGIGRVQHWYITMDQADGLQYIDDQGDAKDLMNKWSVPNSALDVFMVKHIVEAHTLGLSPTDGSCDKDSKNDSGCVILVGVQPFYSSDRATAYNQGHANGYDMSGMSFAHEIGHYLGLPHDEGDPTNLMYPDADGGTWLTSDQGYTMRHHCSVKDGC